MMDQMVRGSAVENGTGREREGRLSRHMVPTDMWCLLTCDVYVAAS